jgi:hypothetical protein
MRQKKKYKSDQDTSYLSAYQRAVLSKSTWLDKANELFKVAGEVEQKVIKFWKSWHTHLKDKSNKIESDKCIGIYLMLVAYGIENLLKALIVVKKRDELKNGNELQKGQLPKILNSHNLVRLCKLAGFPITNQQQEELLRRLSRGAVWYGRYPIPTSYNSGKAEIFLNGKEYIICLHRENDITMIKELIKAVRKFGDD